MTVDITGPWIGLYLSDSESVIFPLPKSSDGPRNGRPMRVVTLLDADPHSYFEALLIHGSPRKGNDRLE